MIWWISGIAIFWIALIIGSVWFFLKNKTTPDEDPPSQSSSGGRVNIWPGTKSFVLGFGQFLWRMFWVLTVGSLVGSFVYFAYKNHEWAKERYLLERVDSQPVIEKKNIFTDWSPPIQVGGKTVRFKRPQDENWFQFEVTHPDGSTDSEPTNWLPGKKLYLHDVEIVRIRLVLSRPNQPTFGQIFIIHEDL
ncbi:hypothetical protein H6775_03580 [Candidatus Nomurabacteria bacterium]|nr:hypothetical protein [Candidatus Nomurabacteria bacterium]